MAIADKSRNTGKTIGWYLFSLLPVLETARIIIYVLIFLVKPQNKIILYLLLSNLIFFN